MSPLDRNWCSRKANSGRPVVRVPRPRPGQQRRRGCAARSRLRRSAGELGQVARRPPAPSSARRRTSRPVPCSASRPNVVSTQPASGSAASAVVVARLARRARSTARRSCSASVAVVRRWPARSVSPITRSGRDLGAEQPGRDLGDVAPAARRRCRRWPSSPTCRRTAGRGARTRPAAGGPAWRRRRPAGRGRCAARRARGTAGPAPPRISCSRSSGRVSTSSSIT